MITENQKKKAQKTDRSTSAYWAKTAVVPKVLLEMDLHPHFTMLDFGCGAAAPHTKMLRHLGFKCFGYDFSLQESDQHLTRKYDIVFASRVLNVQQNTSMMEETLQLIASLLKQEGMFLANYPKDPRYCSLSNKELFGLLKSIFKNEAAILRPGESPTFIVTKR